MNLAEGKEFKSITKKVQNDQANELFAIKNRIEKNKQLEIDDRELKNVKIKNLDARFESTKLETSQ